MGISSILNISKNALYASQVCVQVTSNNISNVNTEGYTRQVAVLEQEASSLVGGLLVGNGVKVSYIERYVNSSLDQQISNKNTELEEQNVYKTYYARIETILNEESSGLSQNITDFFNSWQELTTDPQSAAIREDIASNADNMCNTISSMYVELRNIQVELNENVRQEVNEINSLTSLIASLNQEIFATGTGSSEANECLDKRTQYIKELSGKIDITCLEGGNGQMTIFTSGGKMLVDGGNSWNLAIDSDVTTGFNRISWKSSSGELRDITSSIKGGSLYGYMNMRDQGIQEFIDDLDEIAETLISEVNDIHKSGYTLDSSTGIPFFKELAGNYARDIGLSDDIKADTGKIAAAAELDSDGKPTGNKTALAIASLVDSKLFESGTATIVDFTSSITNRIGVLSKGAKEFAEFSQDTMDSLVRQRESMSGVSLDEEMTNLVKFQYAYQAAARLLTVADELFSSLLEVAR